MSVTAPGYREFSTVIGRGVSGVRRLDVEIEPLWVAWLHPK